MIELEEAVRRICDSIGRLPAESASLAEAHGRFALESINAPLDLPIFDNSAMDGYALRAEDVLGATRDSPIRLNLLAEIPAGKAAKIPLTSGACIRVFTGSPLPEGADAVIMQEDTRIESKDAILCFDAVKPWENVRLRGEDVKRGSPMLKGGDRIRSGTIALLAALGIANVPVSRKPTVGLIATGNELRAPGETIHPGQIFESNRAMLSEPLLRAGAIPQSYMVVTDDLPQTCRVLEQGFSECDAIITTGGVSVGEHDLVKKAFESLGGKLNFWRVAIKPGKPFAFGRWKEKLLFGLPGNPVSAFVTFLTLVRPPLLHWQGAAEISLPACQGKLAEPLVNRGDRRHFMRVHIDGEGNVHSAGVQASHALSSLAKANGLVDVAPNAVLDAGASVNVLRWED